MALVKLGHEDSIKDGERIVKVSMRSRCCHTLAAALQPSTVSWVWPLLLAPAGVLGALRGCDQAGTGLFPLF